MQTTLINDNENFRGGSDAPESAKSAVSWAAVLAGAAVTMAVAFSLTGLGAGIGLGLMPDHVPGSETAMKFTLGAAVWLIIVQWLSAALGGYLTGRLRTKWVGLHTHEVYFRDTAHGFLMWSTATVFGALLLAGAATSLTKGAMIGGPMMHHEAQMSGGQQASGPMDDYIDGLYRTTPGTSGAVALDPQTRHESMHIIGEGLTKDGMPEADHAYLAQQIAAHTGVAQADAEQRIDQTVAKIKDDVSKARKAASSATIIGFLSMLIGAFIASAAAALGGYKRDEF